MENRRAALARVVEGARSSTTTSAWPRRGIDADRNAARDEREASQALLRRGGDRDRLGGDRPLRRQHPARLTPAGGARDRDSPRHPAELGRHDPPPALPPAAHGKVKEVQARIAQDLEDQVGALSEIGLLTIERFRDQLTNLRASEAASAIRDIAQAQKTAVEKSQSLRGDPTHVVVHRPDADELWKQFRRIAPHAFVDSTAEEEEREANLRGASTRAPLAGHIDGIQSADLDGGDPRAAGLRQRRAVLSKRRHERLIDPGAANV